MGPTGTDGTLKDGLERFGSPSRTLKQAVSCTEEHLRKSEDPPQSFATYLKAELAPEPSWPTADAVWGQTERDRVYNALIFVPYQLERLLWYGLLLCLDSFLAIFTILPIRAVLALQTLLMSSAGGGKAERQLSADQLYDLICVAIFGAAMLILYSLDVGVLYFWIKDLTQEFLKLHVIYTAVEIFDKIFCSFGIDCLEALRKRLRQLLCDSGVAFLVVLLHGGVIMCQGMAFSVAMNSKRGNALVALLIAANFVEIKGTVLKRFDSSKLFKLTCSDIVERFHLLVSLSFVLVEDMDNSGTVSMFSCPSSLLLSISNLPAGHWVTKAELLQHSVCIIAKLLRRCAYVFAAEVVIDIIKHAVLGKFNEIRPGVYREFMKDVCENVKSSQSHNVHRIVEFEPIGPAALSLRIFMTYCAVRGSQQARAGWQHELLRLAGCLLLWVAISVLRAALGFLLKYLATLYTHHYQHAFQKSGRNPRTNLSTKQT
eukprot:jgi/Astpho2/7670/Aster-02552